MLTEIGKNTWSIITDEYLYFSLWYIFSRIGIEAYRQPQQNCRIKRVLQQKGKQLQAIAHMIIHTLLTLRSDDSFELFWLKVTIRAESLELEPQLPRRTN